MGNLDQNTVLEKMIFFYYYHTGSFNVLQMNLSTTVFFPTIRKSFSCELNFFFCIWVTDRFFVCVCVFVAGFPTCRIQGSQDEECSDKTESTLLPVFLNVWSLERCSSSFEWISWGNFTRWFFWMAPSKLKTVWSET